MKKSLMIASSLLAVASLAAGKKEAEAPKPAESATASSGGMAEMPMATEMKHGMGVGTVTEIDATKGMVTLAMKMGFAIKPELLAGIKVGDKVNFEIDWNGKAGTVTKIEKAGS